VRRAWQLGVFFLLVGLAAVYFFRPQPSGEDIELEPVGFSDLPFWQTGVNGEALVSFLKSCDVFERKDPLERLSLKEAGSVRDWMTICGLARKTSAHDQDVVRAFFEMHFTPYRIENAEDGLFTGYYEVALEGARKKGGLYQTPLWQKPDDLIFVDLGGFNKEWAGKNLVGKVKDGKLVPYDIRAEIADGSLEKRASPLVWVKDPVQAFFLEIQGSGRVSLKEGGQMHVGYAAQNGHNYVAIGRVLVDMGAIQKPVTMEKIRTWLKENPQRRQEILNKNLSSIFFKEIGGNGPVGAMGVGLTPLRSLAVDPRFIPLGVPLWLSSENHKRLVVAQDTGGAIKGMVRGDLFWGFGNEAEKGAGEMQEKGTYYLLLPKTTETP
jgi:membrane-bound lytic murein transglycosylase A